MAEGDALATATTLDWYVQAIGEEAAFALECKAEADELVAQLVGELNPFAVPESIIARASLEVGADLYFRKTARNGIAVFDGVEAQTAVRINRDPLSAAYPLLRPYIPFGLA